MGSFSYLVREIISRYRLVADKHGPHRGEFPPYYEFDVTQWNRRCYGESGRADLNRRPSAPKADALPRLRYAPIFLFVFIISANAGPAEKECVKSG